MADVEAHPLDPQGYKDLIREADVAARGQNPTRAEAIYRQAIALEPSEAAAKRNFGIFLAQVGRFSEALSFLEEAHALNSMRFICLRCLTAWFTPRGSMRRPNCFGRS
jgi:Tfp pilus assembly protein PilF